MRAVAGQQVADAEDAAGHEPAQRHDRERHVQVEDLLDEALVGVVGRVEEDQANAPTMRTTEAMERVFSPRPNMLVLQQEIEDRVGEQPEHQIIEAEDQQPAAFERPRAACGEQRRRGARAGDDQRDRQRDGQQRHEQVAGARRGSRAPPTSVPTTAMPASASASTAIRPGSGPHGDGPSRRIANAGTSSSSSATRNANSTVALPTNIAVRSTGASRKPSKPPSSRSVANSRFIPSTAANSSVTHSTPAARSPSTSRWFEREVEEHEGAEREQRHRRHRLARAQLEQQVLAHERGDRRVSRVQPPQVGRAHLFRRGDELGAAGAQAEDDVGLRQRRPRRRAS